MRRVSSRQRLVSWDAFDATTSSKNSDDNGSSYSSSDEHSDYDTALMLLTPDFIFESSETKSTSTSASSKQQRRKRGRKSARKHHGPAPHIILSLSSELSTSSSSLQLDELIQDAHLAIASFLDIDSLRHLMGVNTKYRQILLSSDAHYLWMQHAQRKWQATANGMAMTFSDTYHLPTAAGQFSETPINLPLLLSMTPTDLPTQVDHSLLETTKSSAAHPHVRSWRSPSRLNMYNEDDEFGNTVSLIRYTGPIGAGDRCIRANHPFPRPQRKYLRNDSIVPMMEAAHPTLFDLLCRGARAVSGRSMLEWRPFVSPHCDAATGSLQVTPRMVAYYEVAILDPKKSERQQEDDDDDDDLLPPTAGASNTACVAVGVATESFRVHSRMPGWDNQSFGYHGDDGGIFHSSGGMVERFGPCFGAGDTVGCGIDYVAQGIFFTLNGKFIGYGWKGIDVEFLRNDLYPVVGIDTNAPIAVNFGNYPNRPFLFDLAEFTKKHEPLILPNYRFTGRDNNDNNSAPTPTHLRRSERSFGR